MVRSRAAWFLSPCSESAWYPSPISTSTSASQSIFLDTNTIIFGSLPAPDASLSVCRSLTNSRSLAWWPDRVTMTCCEMAALAVSWPPSSPMLICTGLHEIGG